MESEQNLAIQLSFPTSPLQRKSDFGSVKSLPSCAEECLQLVKGFSSQERSCLRQCYRSNKFLRPKGLEL
jgi:hypothetical protein